MLVRACGCSGVGQVITPNVYNLKLWEISGHAAHYKDNMFIFNVEGQEFGMKPMNCPGHVRRCLPRAPCPGVRANGMASYARRSILHIEPRCKPLALFTLFVSGCVCASWGVQCLMFGMRQRSYRELPWRVADFGVLHRNEMSGALTGLTRVRRFQQDDAHIFCRPDDVQNEIEDMLKVRPAHAARRARRMCAVGGRLYAPRKRALAGFVLAKVGVWERWVQRCNMTARGGDWVHGGRTQAAD